jgi:hypothetical protein
MQCYYNYKINRSSLNTNLSSNNCDKQIYRQSRTNKKDNKKHHTTVGTFQNLIEK